MKRSFLLLLNLFLIIACVNAYTYNSSFSNLSLDENGWCIDIPIDFKIYNSTDYSLHKSDDEYDSYLNISTAVVKIYSGPLDSFPVILDTTSSTTGEFEFTFTEANDYLIEIEPTGEYNDYHETLAIDECRRANPSLVSNTTTTSSYNLFDKSYLYTNIKISLNDTDMLSEKNLTVKDILKVGISQNGLTSLNNAVSSFSVKGVNNNYSNMDIEVSLVSIDTNKITKGYFYQNNSWIEKPIEINENKVTFKSASFGIYAITSEEISRPQEVITAPVIETTKPEIVTEQTSTENLAESTNNEVESQPQTEINNNEEIVSTQTNSNQSSSSSIILIIVFVIIGLGAGSFFLFGKSKKPIPVEHVEVLNSYNEIYKHAKKYVQDYKLDYGKDQIYRALESVNVPRDIIDKVFLEEYNS